MILEPNIGKYITKDVNDVNLGKRKPLDKSQAAFVSGAIKTVPQVPPSHSERSGCIHTWHRDPV